MDAIKIKAYSLLRHSEKFFKTDMVYLVKGGFWLTAGKIVSAIGSFLLAIAFANLIPKEAFGTYKYILSIAGILAIFSLPGMSTSVFRSVAKGYEGSLLPAIRARIYWGGIGGLLSLILAGYYYFNGNTTLAFSFLIVAVFLPFIDALSTHNSFLMGRELFKIATSYVVITQLTTAIFMILALFLTKNIFIIIFTYYISNTLLNFILLTFTLKKFKPNTKKDPEVIPYGKHLSVMSIIGTISGHLDKILLWHFLGAAQLAIYSFSLAPVTYSMSFLKSLSNLAFPRFANRDKESIKKTLPKKMLLLALMLIVPVILYIMLVPYFYEFLFPQYLESIRYSQFYSLILLFYPLRLIGAALEAHASKKELYILSTVGPVVKIVLLIILVPLYGIMGAIAALLLPPVIDMFLLIYFLKKM